MNNYYLDRDNRGLSESLEAIKRQINEEISKPDADGHKIDRLQEQMLIQGMFSNNMNDMSYGKYRSPW
jgi:hypothetical protein